MPSRVIIGILSCCTMFSCQTTTRRNQHSADQSAWITEARGIVKAITAGDESQLVILRRIIPFRALKRDIDAVFLGYRTSPHVDMRSERGINYRSGGLYTMSYILDLHEFQIYFSPQDGPVELDRYWGVQEYTTFPRGRRYRGGPESAE